MEPIWNKSRSSGPEAGVFPKIPSVGERTIRAKELGRWEGGSRGGSGGGGRGGGVVAEVLAVEDDGLLLDDVPTNFSA